MNLTKESKGIVAVKWIFQVLAIGVCLYLIIGQMILPVENRDDEYGCKEFSDGWVWVQEDGTRVPIEIPGKCEAERNAVVTIENTLPMDLEDNVYLCVRSSKQEMQIYVDGVLRREYSTEDTRPFGTVSAVAFVFLRLDAEDAGKTVTIVTQTDSSYTGIFHQIYYGDKMGIWRYFFDRYGTELMIAILMLLLGGISIVASIALRLCYHRKIEMEYLGWGVFLAAIWIIANSTFRQMIFTSISVISDMAFFMVMLLAIPFILYLNGIQNERYHKIYIVAVVLNILDFVICTFLHVTNRIDFTDTIEVMTKICAVSIGTFVVTIAIDIVKGYIKEYRLVAFGIFGVSMAAAAQIILYFRRTTPFNGSLIAVGLVFLLIISFINTLKDVLSVEKEKQQAILSNESKGKFLANMSHEIRTPINAILGMDAMILRESKEPAIKEYALDIQNAGQTLLSIINDILDFSKIESGKMEIIPVEYDFSSVIHDVSNMTMVKAQDKGLVMNVYVDQSLPFRLFGDEVRIRQILVNLLSNAVKYTHEGSVTLSVKGEKQGDRVLLHFSVQDTGIGIRQEDISKLFERFERIEEERNRNIEGTGLGMSITMQLLKMMGSQLMVESEYGVGSTFYFDLEQPIVNADPIGDLEERIRQQPLDYHYDAEFVAPEARILMVDDNAVNRKVFVNLLKETKVQIDDVESGKECLELVRQKHYDLIFLDHMMPEMDGIETLHHMKEFVEYPCKDTPVVALTANAILGAREMYLAEGFDDFLSKPIKPEKLERMIQQMLPKSLLVYGEKDAAKSDALESPSEQGVEDLPEIDGIDWSYGWSHLPDQKLLMDTVLDFYRTIDSEADALEGYYHDLEDEEALRQYRIKVHAMKSSAALIGAIPISGMAKILEYAARDGKKDAILRVTPVFLEEWRSYKTKLQVCIKEDEKKEIEDMGAIRELLVKLQAAMEELDIDVADEAMNQLRQYEYAKDIQALVEQLGVAVTNLDSDTAAQLTGEILNKM